MNRQRMDKVITITKEQIRNARMKLKNSKTPNEDEMKTTNK